MKVQEMISTAGGTRANEDRVGHCGTLGWVIDGATDLYDTAALPADSDVQWLVDTIGDRLTKAGADGYRGDPAVLLETVAAEVAQQQAAYEFPSDRVPPACSVAVCVDQGAGFAISRVGDATAVVSGREQSVLATGFFDRREAAAVGSGEVDAQRIAAAMHERRLYTMTSGDTESIFSGHPQRVLRPHSVVGSWADTDHILLCTDGFARLVTDYGLYRGWAEVIADARDRGLHYLEKLIRDVEADARNVSGRFKRADDVAAVLITRD
ncbi:protein phosphatase 2C domain-containing protein [Micromonospora sp. NPDC048930]|uniref:protein phosphatase 2C domain-containing protein n=1 Tax=Micromonospora sp. NPDC048930 TaxID=3364261 RepID=UPI0037243CC5